MHCSALGLIREMPLMWIFWFTNTLSIHYTISCMISIGRV